jgi:hypothetical protein
MKESLTSIIFLAIIILVPIGMVFGIVRMIIKSIKNKSGLTSLAKQNGWQFLGSDTQSVNTVSQILEKTLYTVRDGRHSLANIVQGRYSNGNFYLLYYHYQSRSVHHETRLGGDYTLLIWKRQQKGPSFWMQRRQKGVLAKMAEEMISGQLSIPQDPNWSWLLVSSTTQFTQMNLSDSTSSILQSCLTQGDALFLFEEYIILSSQGKQNKSWAARSVERIEAIEKVIYTT